MMLETTTTMIIVMVVKVNRTNHQPVRISAINSSFFLSFDRLLISVLKIQVA